MVCFEWFLTETYVFIVFNDFLPNKDDICVNLLVTVFSHDLGHSCRRAKNIELFKSVLKNSDSCFEL